MDLNMKVQHSNIQIKLHTTQLFIDCSPFYSKKHKRDISTSAKIINHVTVSVSLIQKTNSNVCSIILYIINNF